MSENSGKVEPNAPCLENETHGKFTFILIQRGDFIKPGWWHWRCRQEDDGDLVAYGYVRADTLGGSVAADTFEKDRQ